MTIETTNTTNREGELEGFEQLSKLAYSMAGLVLSPAKATMIHSRLRHRMKLCGVQTLAEYCDLITSKKADEEPDHMISALTTNVSGFFREPHHFEQLKQLLTNKLQDPTSDKALRIWSAGCSNGQEAYSIAMSVFELLPDVERFDIIILATDIDRKVLEFAKHAEYSEEQASGLDSSRRAKFFEKQRSSTGSVVYKVRDEVKRLIRFNHLNLNGEWPLSRRFDAIFCRNVVIYFDVETQDALWPRFASQLKPEGLLFVGHSERVSSDLFSSIGSTGYKKTGTGPKQKIHETREFQ